MPWWSVGAVVALGLGHILARYAGARAVAGVLKPLPVLVVTGVTIAAAPADARYRAFVLGGLLCSMAGDVWLVFPRGFRPGLANFLVAHLFYIAAFATAGDWGAGTVATLAPFALAGAALLAALWRRLGAERAAVAVYVAVIVVMGWRAAVRAGAPGVVPPSGALALAGALLFMASDTLLAVDRFARPFAAADASVMTTYYAAQALIGASAAM
jgi:uncharacterized membrane protein YhhN